MQKSFTLIELLLAIAILGILAGLSVPFLINFKAIQDLDITTQEVVSVLRKAQERSILAEKNSSWGVNFSQPKKYILFRENFDLNSTENEIYEIPANIGLTSNLSEVKFEKLSGRISNELEITLTGGNKKNKILINQEGTINYFRL